MSLSEYSTSFAKSGVDERPVVVALHSLGKSMVANNTRQVRKLVEKGKELGYAMGALLVPAVRFR